MSDALTRVGVVLLAVAVAGTSGVQAIASPRVSEMVGSVNATEARNYCPDEQEREFLRLVNNHRKKHGVRAVRLSGALGAAADHHSNAMASADFFSHTLPGGLSWSANISQHGYRFNTYRGENIAAGRPGARGAFEQWRDSPGHNATMLDPHFKAIGIGRAYDGSSTYDWYWTTTFGGVVDGGAAC